MTKFKVYIVLKCSDHNTSERIEGVYLNREAANTKIIRLKEHGGYGEYYAVIRKTLHGDYWLSKSGLMIVHDVPLNNASPRIKDMAASTMKKRKTK